MSDVVNRPAHYTAHPSGVECIEITEHMNFNLGNAMKYIWRAGLKGDGEEDLSKAEFYIRREIGRMRLVAAQQDEAKARGTAHRPAVVETYSNDQLVGFDHMHTPAGRCLKNRFAERCPDLGAN
jgi:hypothetical protein